MDKILENYYLRDEQLKQIYDSLTAEIERGLAKKTHDQSAIKCFITYLQHLPSGNEIGQYMALDLGGTNFRVMLVTLKGNDKPEIQENHCKIPKEIMLGNGKHLFDYIAGSIADFIKEKSITQTNMPLGFTFSFPCAQRGLDKAILVRWTKFFNCTDVVNHDVVQMLKDALQRRGLTQINVLAIVNDTIGTLMSCAHLAPECRIALIVGTGCNACYVEKSEKAELLEEEYKIRGPYIIVNTEWGAFGENGALEFIRTDCDKTLDENSLNKGKQLFEKMISGLYLGELLRLILLKATKQKLVFTETSYSETIIEKLSNPEAPFKTKIVSTIEGDTGPNFTTTKAILAEFCNIPNAPPADCKKVKQIAEAISKRAAHLVAVGLSSLVNRVEEPKVVIGVDGAVYRYHPKFDGYVREAMGNMVDPDIKFDILLSEDGSGRGAALVAAVAAREHY